jgi:Protein of unknown function (DUF1579)
MRTLIRILSSGAARKRLLAAGALVLAAGARLKAQECPEFRPTPEHAILAASEGAFDLTFSDGSKGTTSSKLGLGGQWLFEDVKADFCGQSYEGRGATSYDPARKKYVNVWIDSVSAVPLISEGTYDKSTKTLTLVGDMLAPDGSAAKATLVTVYRDADTRTFTMKVSGPGGEGVELFNITYTRAK